MRLQKDEFDYLIDEYREDQKNKESGAIERKIMNW